MFFYLLLGLATGGVIAVVSLPRTERLSAGRRILSAAERVMGQVAPSARFVFSADPDLARELVRWGLPWQQRRAGETGPGWMERLLSGVTGLAPGEPVSFLRQTMITRGSARHAAARATAPETEPDPVLGTALHPPEGEAAEALPAGEPVPDGGTGPARPVPPISRRTEADLRRFPWGTVPLVAIYHTHSSETYHGPERHAKDRSYSPSDHAWGKTSGMISIGGELARTLTQDYRIPVVHSRNIHDYPVYRDAYVNSAVTVKELLRKYPSLRIVLDIHRDGLADMDLDFITTVMGGERLARIAVIVGRGQPGLPNPHWGKNQALAERLHAKMEEMYPGLSRGLIVRNWPYNQELSDCALLLELGDHFNTREEAQKSAGLLADCLAALLADEVQTTN